MTSMPPSLGIAHVYLRALESLDAPRVRSTNRVPPLARVRRLVRRRSH
jgi:hypothetical protein